MAIQERDVDMQDEEDEEVQEVGGETEGEGSGEEEEFEIDGILDSKRGIFEKVVYLSSIILPRIHINLSCQ